MSNKKKIARKKKEFKFKINKKETIALIKAVVEIVEIFIDLIKNL